MPSEYVLTLLRNVERDTSGAISFAQRGERGADVVLVDGDEDLARIIAELPAKPFLAGDEGVSMSLAGVQSKLAVRVFEDGRLGIPINGAASSHILKPDSTRLAGGVQNEAFCLTLAKLCGIEAAEVTTGRAGARAYLLVTRYDRVMDGRQLRRSHQEDFCQALGYPPSAKYQHGSGYRGKKVRFREMMERMRTLNAQEAEKLWDRMVFNVLCCNTDTHAKNYSIHIFGDAFEMTPIYDVMCADTWPNITPYLALDVGSQRKWRDIEGRHWSREAVACGFAGRFGPASAEAMAANIVANLDQAVERVRQMPAGDHAMLGEFRNAVERCCQHTLSVIKRYDGKF